MFSQGGKAAPNGKKNAQSSSNLGAERGRGKVSRGSVWTRWGEKAGKTIEGTVVLRGAAVGAGPVGDSRCRNTGKRRNPTQAAPLSEERLKREEALYYFPEKVGLTECWGEAGHEFKRRSFNL